MEEDNFVETLSAIYSRPVVPNLWYAYLRGYVADRLGVSENNIGNGGKHKKN
jgi:hypothetical protein